MFRFLTFGFLLLSVASGRADPSDVSGLEFEPFAFSGRSNHVNISELPGGAYRIRTTGQDPFVFTEGVVEKHNSGIAHILAFEYRARGDFGKVHYYYQSPGGIVVADSGIQPSEDWKWHCMDLSTLPKDLKWLRFDFGSKAGLEFELRNCRLVEKAGPYQWLGQRHRKISFAKAGHDVERTERTDGGITIQTTGADPYLATSIQRGQIHPLTPYRLAFQYQSVQDAQELQVIYKSASGLKSINRVLQPVEGWRWEFVELPASAPVDWLRFDFGNEAGRHIHLRDCRLMKAAPELDVGQLEHTPFTLQTQGHDATVKPLAGGGWEILTTGNDPYVGTKGLGEAHDPDIPYILAFEYQAPEDFGEVVFYYRTANGYQHANAGVMPANQWTWHLYDFTRDGKGLGEKFKDFRIDFGEQEGLLFKVRNLRIIPATPEIRLWAALGEMAGQVDKFGISVGEARPQRSAIETVRHSDGKSMVVTMAAYRHLDLDAATKRLAGEPSASPPVPLGPRIVAGEGAHSNNHTVVRILSPYQVCETQFLAYPPKVRGGVGVDAGLGGDGMPFIAAWPLMSSKEVNIRLFNRHGGRIGEIAVPGRIKPPFTVAVGDFEPGLPGEEIAVASQKPEQQESQALVFTQGGKLLNRFAVPGGKGRHSLLARGDSGLVVQELASQTAYQLLPEERVFRFSDAPEGFRLFDSIYPGRDFNVGGPQGQVSTLHTWKAGKLSYALDAGRMENLFWFDPQETHAGDKATWGSFPDGKYVRNGRYNFLGAAQYWSPLVESGNIEGRSYTEWTDINWEKVMLPQHRKSIADYDSGVPTVWSAGFTHRWGIQKMKPVCSKLDPQTWLPRYLLLDRKNSPTGGGYFGKRLFDYGSQHFEDEALDKLYTYAQRAFHRKLAPAYRRNPEMTIAVEPNHENEIVSGADSIGDYNPGNLLGFHHYLMATYGSLDALNQKMGTAFSTNFFDAPRNIFRGDWDRYHPDNRYFHEWVQYNRIVVSRRVGTSYREALLAGFPPELIKCHQIPDSYVFGSIVGISEREKRVSPIDWMLTTGAGFGFSRYGTFYDRKHNIGQGAHSSGFDGMLVGEYASLNPSPEKALQQLLYLRGHGVSALHVMWWPSHLDKGYNTAQEAALRKMVAHHDVPCHGYAGGIAEVRPYKGQAGSFDIASLGTGERHTGLLKSLREDGSFEGTVYTVPFHAHVGITELARKESMQVTPESTLLATVPDVRPGCVLEVSFQLDESLPPKSLRLDFAGNGLRLEDKAVTLKDLHPGQHIRVVYKLPLVLEEVSLGIAAPAGTARIKGLSVFQHQDQTINLAKNIMEGQRHQGGVSFDCLPAE